MSGPSLHTRGIWAPFSWPVRSPSEDLGARTVGLPPRPPEKMSLVRKHSWPQKYYWTEKRKTWFFGYFDFSFIKCNYIDTLAYKTTYRYSIFENKITLKSVSACSFSLILSFKNTWKQLSIFCPFRIEAYTYIKCLHDQIWYWLHFTMSNSN